MNQSEYLIISPKLETPNLDDYPNLKVIGTPTTGLDHLPTEECEKRNIKIVSLRDYPGFLETIPATAEHTMGLIFALLRKIPHAFNDALLGNWNRQRFVGTELKGKTIGIIGYGRIGKMVGDYCEVFGMNVLHCDTKDGDYFASLIDLVQKSDIITLHIPLDGNINFFDKTLFDYMKPGSFLVNTSRGKIVDEEELLSALEDKIGGAALDVLTGEPSNLNIKIIEYARTHENLILTPHLGGATTESQTLTRNFIEEKVKEYFKNAISI